ncbi:MAG: 2-amino-4-hydroxy-6-hydroxymethyldihydropteridine diphosphokinase, partial [Bacteroidia bacterium]|nr:2-amino-4-hydroxy-6-hydroxymethyldihydropteridine diphosphokinase [Bacteroidia bacterium]
MCCKIKDIDGLNPKDVMNVVFLGLGGNLGDRLLNLETVTGLISRDCGEILNRSLVYETDAWGSKSNNKYLNMVLKLQTKHSAQNLIKILNSIEESVGRKRSADRNSDRITDIDILFFNHE